MTVAIRENIAGNFTMRQLLQAPTVAEIATVICKDLSA
ncbi:hypothetical protein FE394_07560 [Xenorhabdus sp. Reich]|uniref:Uncharacterized protein n=1 Tax=Xenorhabdus littoralis TaxID=2582835 RepID=A0ABU4SK81_9GAMM|nr:hypothetical protein [Xenorhabdus sp. psl]MDX7999057.1 hypothetical protein [Xenorhabdus sp. Reich]